jgi:hypothetical protein
MCHVENSQQQIHNAGWDSAFVTWLSAKPEKGLRCLCLEASEEDEDEGLPADLAKIIGLGDAKKDATTKISPEEKEAAKEKQVQAKLQKAKESFDKRVDLHSQVGDKDNLAKAQAKCSTMHSMMTQMVQKMKVLIKAMNKARVEYPKLETQNLIDKLEKHIITMDKLIVGGQSVEAMKKALMVAAATLKSANGQQVGNQHLLDKKKS